MAIPFLPDPDGYDADDLIEQIGADLAERYATAGNALLEAAARRAYKIVALEAQGAEGASLAERQQALRDAELERAAALSELRKISGQQVATIRRENLAQTLITEAARDGIASAAAQLAPLGKGRVTTSAAQSVASLVLDLQSKLDVLNQRITRYPNDIYQQVMSQHSPRVLLGVDTSLGAQQKAVQQFLSEGIGHIDYLRKDGTVHLRMPIGSYAEMAGRTSAQRAWQDAGIHRMQQSGINLVTINGGADACKHCAPWIGKILSTDGTTGTVTVSHATTGKPVTVSIAGTMEDWRASGAGHPNDRCRATAYSPGLTIPQAGTTYDPAAEKERARQRDLERQIRAAKRDVSIAPDDVARRRAQNKVADKQSQMRDFIAETGRARRSYREQLSFADGS